MKSEKWKHLVSSVTFLIYNYVQTATALGVEGKGENTHKHYYYKTVNNCRIIIFLNFYFLKLTFPPLDMNSLSSYNQFKLI